MHWTGDINNKEDYYATGGHKSANRHIIEGFALGSAYTHNHCP
ncbi:Hpnb [Staphylococcus aureus]|uniref:Hpnb n=1 Tax=Staphylococcus aureus TaxID=1280 RepID=A0A380EMT8_STAAU|nr:Hpnb [Staphylococcus aureus]